MENGLIIGGILLGVVALYAIVNWLFPAPDVVGLTVLENIGHRPPQPTSKSKGIAPPPPPVPPTGVLGPYAQRLLPKSWVGSGLTSGAIGSKLSKVFDCRVIPTYCKNHVPNGFLVPIWSALGDGWRPDQVYLTAVYPGSCKGPHMHKKREGRFCCVFGDVKIVTRENGEYREHPTGQRSGYPVVHVPPGVPAQIINASQVTALVINMPSPAWSAEDPDEWPVEGWDYGQ